MISLRILKAYFVALVLTGCSGEFINISDTELSISPYLNLPIGSVEMSMGDVVPDTGFISQDSNFFLVKYSVDSALTLFADSLLPSLPPLVVQDSSDVANVVLPSFSQSADLTLGEFGPTSNLSGGLFVFPPLGPIYGGSQALQGNSPVCSATISQGSASLTVTNSWPVPVQISVALVNNLNGTTVTNFVFPPILPGGSASQTKSLIGKTFSNNMSFEIVNVQSPGSSGSPVPYTPNDQITFFIQTNNLEVNSGSVVFPQSQLFASSDFYDFGLPSGVQLQEVFIKRAVIRYGIEVPINGLVSTSVSIPFSDNFGSPFGFTINSTPGLAGTGRVVLQNVRVDLSKMPGIPYNRLPLEVESNIVSTSSCVGFSTSDELSYRFELDSIELDAVVGQFGSYDLNIEETFNFNNLNLGLDYDQIVFYGPELSIDFENSIGIPVFIDLGLKSTNTFGVHQEQVTNFPVSYPTTNGFPLVRESSLVVQPDTATPFIVLPSQTLDVDIKAKIRSTGNPTPPHFIQLGEDMNINVNLVQKSRFSVENLRYLDTVEVSITDTTILSDIIEAFWGMAYQNGLPFSIDIDIKALDVNKGLLFNKVLEINGSEGEARVDLTAQDIGALVDIRYIVWALRFDSSTNGDKSLNVDDKLKLNLSLGARLKLDVL